MRCGGNQNPIKETTKSLLTLKLRGDTKLCDVEISLRKVFKTHVPLLMHCFVIRPHAASH